MTKDVLRLSVADSASIDADGKRRFSELDAALNDLLRKRVETIAVLRHVADKAESAAKKGKVGAIVASGVSLVGSALGIAAGVTTIVLSGGVTLPLVLGGAAGLASVAGAGTSVLGKHKLSAKEKALMERVQTVLAEDDASYQQVKSRLALIEPAKYNSVRMTLTLLKESKSRMELSWTELRTLLGGVLVDVAGSLVRVAMDRLGVSVSMVGSVAPGLAKALDKIGQGATVGSAAGTACTATEATLCSSATSGSAATKLGTAATGLLAPAAIKNAVQSLSGVAKSGKVMAVATSKAAGGVAIGLGAVTASMEIYNLAKEAKSDGSKMANELRSLADVLENSLNEILQQRHEKK